MKVNAPFGTWPSPISAAMVAGSSNKLSDVTCYQNKVFWCESLADEKGRATIMMHDGQQRQSILPAPLSAKSKVHEYGGGAYTVHGNQLIFVLCDDQQIYCGDYTAAKFCPQRLTSDTDTMRFADLYVDTQREQVIAVCESHSDGKVINTLVALPLEGGELSTLHEGFDFYANPSVSADGKKIAWLCWNDPNMPWDCNELWVADITREGLNNARKVVGNGDESLFQPQWSEDNELVFVSDRSDWWNLYYLSPQALSEDSPQPKSILTKDAEFATPQWVFGMSTYGFIDANTLLATYTTDGIWRLMTIVRENGKDWDQTISKDVLSECTHVQSMSCNNGRAVFLGASPSTAPKIFCYENNTLSLLSGYDQQTAINTDEFSVPDAITFNTSDNQVARALFYPPTNTGYQSKGEQPPLIVICHGGPTGATESSLNLKIQYWTNRGFAVADVNYRGSTGYGRDYRQRLFDRWGIYDVDDVCAVVDHLANEGLIDKQRCVIKGGSAGGYTTLAALAYRDTFSAGVSLYGVGDLEMLAKETHKFEARYLDKLIGPYPERTDIYRARSPIHAIDNIDCPLLIFQGLLDKVVPPNQAQTLYEKVKAKGLPVALVTYEDEAHGFRKSENIIHCLESELLFYARLFDIDIVAPEDANIHIENLTQ